MGPADDLSLTHLGRKRRGREIQSVPCDATYQDDDDDGNDERSETFMLYDMREESIDDAVLGMLFTTVVIGLMLIFSVIFSADAEAIANEIVVPMRRLMEDMSHTSKLELDQVKFDDSYVSEVYEMRNLQASFTNLYGAVGSFSKFTPLEVVRHFLSLGREAQLGVTERNVTIFFSDIAGFTTICESTSPPQVLMLLSEYFERMVSIIVEEGGTMLEFIGDAILAIWNAPNSVPDHAERAVTSALRMHKSLVILREKWQSEGKPNIRIRCGLHSANVFVGNLGSSARMKYGVLGDGVNLASRLEELNKRYDTEVLISEAVLKQNNAESTFVVRPIDLVVVKGRKMPTPIYEVLDDRVSAPEDIIKIETLTKKAMQTYRNRQFEDAIETLKQVRQLKPMGKDVAGDVLMRRCQGFLLKPPPSDWDGSEVLTQKSF
jgi:adenylate cyclase